MTDKKKTKTKKNSGTKKKGVQNGRMGPPLTRDGTRTQPVPKVPKGTRPSIQGPGSPLQNDGRKTAEGISAERYLQMVDAYFDNPTIYNVQKLCGVSYVTAKKYIHKGNKKRAMKPIHELYAAAQRKAVAKKEKSWRDRMESWLDSIQMTKEKVDQRLEAMMPDELSAKEAIDAMQKLVSIESFASGGPSERMEVAAQTSFAEYTDDELEEYLSTGKEPARVMNRIPTKLKDEDFPLSRGNGNGNGSE